jgi:5,5'-dehydrodivanillate O-demethylase
VNFRATEDGSEPDDAFEPTVEIGEPYKEPADKLYPEAKFLLQHVIPQDHMAWETQGPIANREIEHLSYSDRGVVLLRKVMREQIEKVQRGEDPMGVQRDPNHEMVDTNIEEDFWRRTGGSTAAAGASRQ